MPQTLLQPSESALVANAGAWPLGRRLLFRFTAVYVLLFLTGQGFSLLAELPGVGLLGGAYVAAEGWLVGGANRYLFHVKEQLVPLNGSGDTSYGYAQLSLFSLLAVVGAGIWSVAARQRAYDRLNYWLIVGLRYFVAATALSYGSIKLFAGQMPFPGLSQLATPLGDLLPMRLAWMFVGYSAPYQIFSGLMELVAGALLLYRRTATLGALVAAGVFLNVLLLNLCYDIPVKLFAAHLFVFSALLLLADGRRLLAFFVLNRATAPQYEPLWADRRVRWLRIGLKVAFVLLYGVASLLDSYQFSQEPPPEAARLVPGGYYEVTSFRPSLPDSLRWQNVVFEPQALAGSIQTADTLFRQRYHRGYFNYALDSTRQRLVLTKNGADTLLRLQFAQPAPDRLVLRGPYHGDTLTVALHRVPRHFQLAERQFHWLSEANR